MQMRKHFKFGIRVPIISAFEISEFSVLLRLVDLAYGLGVCGTVQLPFMAITLYVVYYAILLYQHVYKLTIISVDFIHNNIIVRRFLIR
jgi:hypothetical protein